MRGRLGGAAGSGSVSSAAAGELYCVVYEKGCRAALPPVSARCAALSGAALLLFGGRLRRSLWIEEGKGARGQPRWSWALERLLRAPCRGTGAEETRSGIRKGSGVGAERLCPAGSGGAGARPQPAGPVSAARPAGLLSARLPGRGHCPAGGPVPPPPVSNRPRRGLSPLCSSLGAARTAVPVGVCPGIGRCGRTRVRLAERWCSVKPSNVLCEESVPITVNFANIGPVCISVCRRQGCCVWPVSGGTGVLCSQAASRVTQ